MFWPQRSVGGVTHIPWNIFHWHSQPVIQAVCPDDLPIFNLKPSQSTCWPTQAASTKRHIYGQRASVLMCVCGQVLQLHSGTGAHLCHSLALDQLTGSAPTPYFPRNFKPREKDQNASPPFSLSLRMIETCPEGSTPIFWAKIGCSLNHCQPFIRSKQ